MKTAKKRKKARKPTRQEVKWAGAVKYANDYFLTPPQLDRKWEKAVSGVPRSEMNEEFFGSLPRSLKILEVGCNVGNQPAALRVMGFKKLYGIELCAHAVKIANKRRKWLHAIQGNACKMPYPRGCFDLVFTTWVLTHINPKALPRAISEIYRCSRRYILGCEPYRDSLIPEERKPKRAYLWRADFIGIFMKMFPDLTLVKAKLYRFPQPKKNYAKEQEMYLLEKRP